MARYCTMLKIGNFRYWFEKRYGRLCEYHDMAYKRGVKWEGDKALFKGIWNKGGLRDKSLATLTFVIVQMPWVWAEYLWKKYV